jgi:hypothetical protein
MLWLRDISYWFRLQWNENIFRRCWFIPYKVQSYLIANIRDVTFFNASLNCSNSTFMLSEFSQDTTKWNENQETAGYVQFVFFVRYNSDGEIIKDETEPCGSSRKDWFRIRILAGTLPILTEVFLGCQAPLGKFLDSTLNFSMIASFYVMFNSVFTAVQ